MFQSSSGAVDCLAQGSCGTLDPPLNADTISVLEKFEITITTYDYIYNSFFLVLIAQHELKTVQSDLEAELKKMLVYFVSYYSFKQVIIVCFFLSKFSQED